MRDIFQYIFKDTFQHYNPGEKLDRKVITVVITSAVCLMVIYYWGNLESLESGLGSLGLQSVYDSFAQLSSVFPNHRLFELTYWTFIRFIFYVLLPVILIRAVYKESLSDYGLDIRKAFSGYKIYLFFLAFMIPLVILVSYSDAFQDRYPFYDPKFESLYPNFILWQCLYLFQFFCLEFFFRGFMVHGTKHKLGFYSIFLMLIPYMMIHFGKPMLETTGAIMAGIALGALSLRNNSIWQGVFIHYGIAITMDLAALTQKGYFE